MGASGTQSFQRPLPKPVTNQPRRDPITELNASLSRFWSETDEREKTEATLQEMTTELEVFAYTLAHELRAPVRAMIGFTELVLRQCGNKLGAEGRARLGLVVRAAERQDSLVRDLIACCLLCTRQPRTESVDVEELTRDIIEEQPALQPPVAEIIIESPLLRMRAHAGFLGQCLSHLLENAAKFVPAGIKPEIRVRTESVGAEVRLSIEDNGIGIPRELKETILGCCEHASGTEIFPRKVTGLAVVRKAIARMGGKLGIESKPGNGSRFWIQLPKGDPV